MRFLKPVIIICLQVLWSEHVIPPPGVLLFIEVTPILNRWPGTGEGEARGSSPLSPICSFARKSFYTNLQNIFAVIPAQDQRFFPHSGSGEMQLWAGISHSLTHQFLVTSEVATSGAVTYFHSKLWQKACFPMHRPLSIQNSSPHFPSNPVMTTHPSSYPCIYIYQGPIPPPLQWEISQSIQKRCCRVNFASLQWAPWGWRREGEIKHPSSNLGITLLLSEYAASLFLFIASQGLNSHQYNLIQLAFLSPCINIDLNFAHLVYK